MTAILIIIVCQGRKKGKDGKEEKSSQQQYFKKPDFLPGVERNVDIFLLAANRHIWLVKRGYRWVCKPCFDWTEGMRIGQRSESNQCRVPGKSLNQSESPSNEVREVKEVG